MNLIHAEAPITFKTKEHTGEVDEYGKRKYTTRVISARCVRAKDEALEEFSVSTLNSYVVVVVSGFESIKCENVKAGDTAFFDGEEYVIEKIKPIQVVHRMRSKAKNTRTFTLRRDS